MFLSFTIEMAQNIKVFIFKATQNSAASLLKRTKFAPAASSITRRTFQVVRGTIYYQHISHVLLLKSSRKTPNVYEKVLNHDYFQIGRR